MGLRAERNGEAISEEAAQSIKESKCYIALDFDKEVAALSATESEYISCPEALFRPSLAGIDSKALQDIIFETVGAYDFDSRASLFRGVVLAGGTTMLPG